VRSGARSHGYWGDSCNTIFLGEPDSAFQKLYTTTERRSKSCARRFGRGLPPPSSIGRCVPSSRKPGEQPDPRRPRIGTGVHEWPRLVPGQEVTLEPNMVVMVEPGAYEPGLAESGSSGCIW
jgi:Xaa-Pro aminopeptidase